jgi:hypothetical protein
VLRDSLMKPVEAGRRMGRRASSATMPRTRRCASAAPCSAGSSSSAWSRAAATRSPISRSPRRIRATRFGGSRTARRCSGCRPGEDGQPAKPRPVARARDRPRLLDRPARGGPAQAADRPICRDPAYKMDPEVWEQLAEATGVRRPPRRRRHPPSPEQGQDVGRGAGRRRHPRRVEAQIAAAKAAGVTSLLFDRATGLPWTQPNLESRPAPLHPPLRRAPPGRDRREGWRPPPRSDRSRQDPRAGARARGAAVPRLPPHRRRFPGRARHRRSPDRLAITGHSARRDQEDPRNLHAPHHRHGRPRDRIAAAQRLGATQTRIPGLWNAPGYPELTSGQLLDVASRL